MPTANEIDAARVQQWARAVGFDEAGIAPVALPQHDETLHAWVDAGYAASMQWLTRNLEVRLDLRERFPWAKSVIVAMRSYRPDPSVQSGGIARFMSSYAAGVDYHDVLLPRLNALADRLRGVVPDLSCHAYVDTGPVLERQLAVEAGLGWSAKNSLLLNPVHGSRFFLGVLITDLDLPPTPRRLGSCGTCRSCQVACPTEAFVEPGVLDASRCISYLTIELRGPIPRELRPAMGQWLFGCDLCQTCCPFEAGASVEGDSEFEVSELLGSIELPELLSFDDSEFRARFRRTALWRPRRVGLLRNALIVAGNGEHYDCVGPAVELLGDADAILRDAASWALGRLGVRGGGGGGAVGVGAVGGEDGFAGKTGVGSVIDSLRGALDHETEEWVRDGMREDLARLGGDAGE